MKSAAKAYHDELKALFTKVIEHHRNRDFDLWPSVVDRLRELLSQRAEKLVELQMAAEDAELEWEDERRQEKVRRLEAAYDAGMELVAAYGTIAELRRENAELSRVCERTREVISSQVKVTRTENTALSFFVCRFA